MFLRPHYCCDCRGRRLRNRAAVTALVLFRSEVWGSNPHSSCARA